MRDYNGESIFQFTNEYISNDNITILFVSLLRILTIIELPRNAKVT